MRKMALFMLNNSLFSCGTFHAVRLKDYVLRTAWFCAMQYGNSDVPRTA